MPSCEDCMEHKENGHVYCGSCGTLFWKSVTFEIIAGVICTPLGLVMVLVPEKPDPLGYILLAFGGYAIYRIVAQISTAYEIKRSKFDVANNIPNSKTKIESNFESQNIPYHLHDKDSLPQKKDQKCVKCDASYFEYDTHWKEYTCKNCGWISE